MLAPFIIDLVSGKLVSWRFWKDSWYRVNKVVSLCNFRCINLASAQTVKIPQQFSSDKRKWHSVRGIVYSLLYGLFDGYKGR